jgi:hypothetical protein
VIGAIALSSLAQLEEGDEGGKREKEKEGKIGVSNTNTSTERERNKRLLITCTKEFYEHSRSYNTRRVCQQKRQSWYHQPDGGQAIEPHILICNIA